LPAPLMRTGRIYSEVIVVLEMTNPRPRRRGRAPLAIRRLCSCRIIGWYFGWQIYHRHRAGRYHRTLYLWVGRGRRWRMIVWVQGKKGVMRVCLCVLYVSLLLLIPRGWFCVLKPRIWS
jgi:hypothetical protein